MKCLSMMQPWAQLLCLPLKDVENRGRRSSYRGPCLIHASKTLDYEAIPWIRVTFGDSKSQEIIGLLSEYRPLPTGAIIGKVNIDNCVTASVSPWFFGPYGYVRSSPVLFEKPIPYRGLPSLFFEVPCTAETPCCDRRDEYNGFASGPLKFVCPMHCRCHD